MPTLQTFGGGRSIVIRDVSGELVDDLITVCSREHAAEPAHVCLGRVDHKATFR